MTLLISKAGTVKTERQWRAGLDDFWREMHRDDTGRKILRPVDAWERFVRVVGLTEIRDETASNGYNGVF